MTNLTTYPRENQYESQIVGEISSGASTPFDITVKQAPGFTLSGGDTVYAVLEPGTSKEEGIEITAISSTTLTVGTRGLPKEKGGSATTTSHGGGSTIIFSDNWQTFDDVATAVNSKLDNDGGNPTTTFDLQVSGSNFRLRKDGNDMKFTDDNQAETTLSTLAAASGIDEKIKITSNDTTAAYLDSKLTAGDGLSKTEVNDGSNETLDLDVDTSDTNTFVKTSSGASDENKVPVLGSNGSLVSGWIPFLIFGNGSDGDVTTSGNVTLTSDKFYDDLTVSSGDEIDTNGYRIFVKGTLTVESTGVIKNNGSNGSNGNDASGGTPGTGGAGGAGGTGNSLPAGTAGSSGGDGGYVANGDNGDAGTAKTKCFHSLNGRSGGSGGTSTGTGATRPGGSGGSGGSTTDTRKNIPGTGISEYTFAENNGTLFTISGGSGGGGGGGSDNNIGGTWTGAGGGGGGGTGGFVAIYAKKVVINGSIQVVGGDGGDGGNSTDGGGGGGGAGGNGGTLLIVTTSLTGTGSLTVTGGSGGTAGTGGQNNAANGNTGRLGTTETVIV